MKKIPTIFDREWNGNRGVIDKYEIVPAILEGAVATEKVDGTNVRITVRSGRIVRLEKRRNPTNADKALGIVNPWYVEANRDDKSDKHIWAAADTYGMKQLNLVDGEYSAEAYGEKIQGNHLHIVGNKLYVFSTAPQPLPGCPIDYEGLKKWLATQQSKVHANENVFIGIEGIVWHKDGEPIAKIKLKDFK